MWCPLTVIAFSAKRAGDGTWQVTDIDLPRLPAWHIRIDALVSDFERVSLEATVDIEE